MGEAQGGREQLKLKLSVVRVFLSPPTHRQCTAQGRGEWGVMSLDSPASFVTKSGSAPGTDEHKGHRPAGRRRLLLPLCVLCPDAPSYRKPC